MKTVLRKLTEAEARAYSGPVLVPVLDDLSGLPYGEVAATLSWTAKAILTAKQMRSIHLYCKLLCEALNNAGLDMVATMKVLSKKGKIPWSPEAVKERLWRPVMIDTYGKESTTKLTTEEVSGNYEALNLVTSEKLGVSVPFPDRFSMLDKLQR